MEIVWGSAEWFDSFDVARCEFGESECGFAGSVCGEPLFGIISEPYDGIFDFAFSRAIQL